MLVSKSCVTALIQNNREFNVQRYDLKGDLKGDLKTDFTEIITFATNSKGLLITAHSGR